MIYFDRPLNWNNVSLNEYLEYYHLVIDNKDELEDEDLVLQQIQIFYNKNPYKMGMPEFKKCIEGLRFLDTDMPKMKVKEQYNLNGNIYYLHKELNEFKVGQYIDYERIMQEKKGIDSYAEFIALFLTPYKEQSYGDGYDVQAVINDIGKYMSIADATSITAFFLNLSKAYVVRFLLYSQTKAMRAMKDKKKKKELKRKTRQLIKMVIRGE